MNLRPAPGPDFYDAVLDDPLNDMALPVHKSSYLDLYYAALRHVRQTPIVELGCGTGQFASLVADDDDYLGIDFSPVFIARARETNPTRKFILANLALLDSLPPAWTYIVLETLEHLDDDLALLRKIPASAHVIISVPSFDSAAHVRIFPRESSALARYESLINFSSWQKLVANEDGDFIHLLVGERRG